jgi:hypothetical protein
LIKVDWKPSSTKVPILKINFFGGCSLYTAMLTHSEQLSHIFGRRYIVENQPHRINISFNIHTIPLLLG